MTFGPHDSIGSTEVGDSLIVGVVGEANSIAIPAWILVHPDLNARSVRLWGMMRGALTGVLSVSDLTHEALAQMLEVGKRTAQEAVYELRDASALSIEPRFKGGKQVANTYYLWPATAPDDESIAPPEPKTSDKKRGAKGVVEYSEEFEQLWEIYPRKINKSGAYRCYKKKIKDGHPHSDLMIATTNLAAVMTKEARDPSKIMHGSTFFGPDNRWLDYAASSTTEVVPVMSLSQAALDAANVYEEFDNFDSWELDGVVHEDHPLKHGIDRPRNNEGQYVDVAGEPYELDSQGKRRAIGYMR